MANKRKQYSAEFKAKVAIVIGLRPAKGVQFRSKGHGVVSQVISSLDLVLTFDTNYFTYPPTLVTKKAGDRSRFSKLTNS
ncbi:MAG: hypothetical protein KME15_16790 [Drouetiella hepatica Uher 2000/2452]|uniref:Transposase n=1 Tax=Drouetiella hepatica Uher 2000/2452 TaxID=904376 RepID=A0A951QFB0_9CYAN|nr:hypothetical protein [Drouetiella hepatica Uher 2000/2452]